MLKRFFIITLALLAHLTASACEYNVRDVGFVDLDASNYHLYVYIDKTSDATQREMLEDSLFMGFIDANFEATLVDVDAPTEATQAAVKFLEGHEPATYPAGLLVSPKGHTLHVDIADSIQAGAEAFEAQLKTFASSPFRTDLLKQVTKNYGVVFIIEGPDTDENSAVQEAAQRAVRKVHTRMKMLPKVIANPPVIMTLKRDQFETESLLLWSFGLKPDSVDKAHVTVLYGRGRQMGPVMTGEAITEKRLASYMQVIGADCECGLDRSWMQGTMIPLLWTSEIQDEVSMSLGFDPENPRTKMEISMTVAKGQTNRSNSGSETKNPDSVDKLNFVYSENEVTFEEDGEQVIDDDSTEIVELSKSLYDGDETRATGQETTQTTKSANNDTPTTGVPRLFIIILVIVAVIIGMSVTLLIGAFQRE